MRGPRHLGALPGWLGHRQPPPRGLLPRASQGQRAALSHATTSPRCIGAPGERFSSHFSPVLPSSPGAGRCHPTVSSNPSRTDHALFLTPREEHVKGWSSTETEARSCQPRLTLGRWRGGWGVGDSSHQHHALGIITAQREGARERLGCLEATGSARGKASTSSTGSDPSMTTCCKSPCSLPESPGCSS